MFLLHFEYQRQLTSKAYRIYNLRTQTLEESMHVKFDEFEDQPTVHIADDEEDEPVIAQNHDSDENLTSHGPPKTWRNCWLSSS